MDQNEIVQQFQAQIANLQEQLNQATQALAHANNNINTLQNNHSSNNGSSLLKCGKPEKFSGTNVRSWLVSIENIFTQHANNEREEAKIKIRC